MVGGNKWPSLAICPKTLHRQKKSALIIEVGSSRDGTDLAEETMVYMNRGGVRIVIAIDLPPPDFDPYERYDTLTGVPREASYTVTVSSVVHGQQVSDSTKSVFWRSDRGAIDGQLSFKSSDFYHSQASDQISLMYAQQDITISWHELAEKLIVR